MSYPALIQKAKLLIEQHRPELAEETLKQAIGLEPEEGVGYALLAVVQVQLKQADAAIETAQRGLMLDPGEALAHYAHSMALAAKNRHKQALTAIDGAIALEPDDPDYHAVKAGIHIEMSQWRLALEAAQTGLEFDAEHTVCQNFAAIALTKLRRRDEAGRSIQTALAKDPEDALSHANMGWTLLHAGDHRKAAEHFREALRLEPNLEWAREGIIEALKARHLIYRWVLGFVLWLSSFSPRTQILLFVGVIVLLQLLLRLPEDGPLLTVGITLAIVYMIFVSTLWIANPLFNLLLRFNRFGRLVLSDEQKTDTNWLALAIVVVSGLAITPLIVGYPIFDVLSYSVLMMAVGVTLAVPRSAKRKQAVVILLGLFVVAGCYWYRWYLSPESHIHVIVAAIEKNEVQFDAEMRKLGNPPVADTKAYISAQMTLGKIFVWGAALMTWGFIYFRR